MIAHYINPYVTEKSASFDLLILDQGETLLRVSKKFFDNGETEEQFEEMLLNSAKESYLGFCEENQLEAQEITQVIIDWPTVVFVPQALPFPTPPKEVSYFRKLYNNLFGV